MSRSARPTAARACGLSLAAAVATLAALEPARADAVADFYKNATLDIVVGSAVGGGYDAYARFLARHIARYIPGNPNVIVKNMPGAGGMIAGNFVYNQAAKDGTVITHLQNTLTIDQITGTPNLALDMRQFQWVGSMNTLASICVLNDSVPFKSAKDFLEREYIVGATQGAGASTSLVPEILNALVGTKFRIVTGYTSTSTVLLGMERKEVDGMCGWGWDSAQVQSAAAIDAGKIRVGIDIGNVPHPELARRKVPFVMDMLPDSTDKQALHLLLSPQNYGRPFAAAPGVPADRLAALRTAFAAALKDKAFLEEAGKAKLEIIYMPPEEIARAVKAAFDAPEAVRRRAIDVMTKASKK